MKLISWNVNGLRAVIKKGFFDFFEKQFRFVPLFSPISRGSNPCNAKSDYIRKGG